MSNHKPITEAELKEMEKQYRALVGIIMLPYHSFIGDADGMCQVCGKNPYATSAHKSPPNLDIGERLIAEVRRLQKGAADQPCEFPGCDGVELVDACPHPHRHFKDGRWLDDGSEM